MAIAAAGPFYKSCGLYNDMWKVSLKDTVHMANKVELSQTNMILFEHALYLVG